MKSSTRLRAKGRTIESSGYHSGLSPSRTDNAKHLKRLPTLPQWQTKPEKVPKYL